MSFGEVWKNAANENIEPPRGTYKVKIIPGGNAFVSKNGDDCCKLNLEIVEGEHKGSRMEHFMWFGHEVGARINREALLAYGLENPDGIQTIEDLDDRLARLVGRTAEIGVSYKDGRMNINVTGSRAAEGQATSDIPSNGFEQATSTAGAQFGDDSPF